MVINVEKIKNKRPNYFITEDEIKILIEYSKKWSSKFQLILWFALLRGLRVGEIVAINLHDFNNDFTELRVIYEKSHVQDTIPIIEPLRQKIMEYVNMNQHTLKDGYLFPYYNKKKYNHMAANVVQPLMAKMRKEIGETHSSFLDRTEYRTKNGCIRFRYRIGFHSLRRYFETYLYDNGFKRKEIADIMRYLDSGTVDTYIDPYKMWKEERERLSTALNPVCCQLNMIGVGQRRLTQY